MKPSRWEVLGAWLGIWTPPVGAEIPPVPVRRIALGAALGVVAVAGILLATGATRRDNERREARADAQAAGERRAALERSQRVVRVRVEPYSVAAAEAAVLAEARTRHAAGELAQRADSVECAPAPGATLRPHRLAYDCDAVTTAIPNGEGEAVGRLSFPFRAVLDAPRGRLSICALNPPAGEQGLPDPRETVPLPPACQLS